VATEKYRCSNCGREFAVHPVIKDSQLCCPDCGKNYVQRGDFQRGPGHKNGSCRRDSVIVSADRKEGPDDSEPKE
jgi:DNA-directed RNA polymerase subunit RPC12/RpoP